MKRVKAACIMQTLIFSQKEVFPLTRDEILRLNKAEIEKYKESLEKTRTRYQITDTEELEDGSIQIKVRKQYNDKAEVDEYFA